MYINDKMNFYMYINDKINFIILIFSETNLLNIISVGEFRKTRHPRNVGFNKILEACFSGAGNSRFSEAWNL
jgi:hypothetical protein